jgi:uncharacterized protein YjiS (DUF1127 family)
MTRSIAPLAPSLRSVVTRSVVSGFRRQIAAVMTAIRHRHEVKHLAELDDRALKDIGLVRGDVEAALAEPLFRDPSSVLVRSAHRDARDPKMVAERTIRPMVRVANGPVASRP